MQYSRTCISVLLLILIGCQAQKSSSSKKWYKGNLHTHSYWSDGDEFPEIIMEWYKSHDYQFVALTDHNILAKGDKWKVISRDSIYQSAFQNYLIKYGETWVNYKTDSLNQLLVKLKTYEEYRRKFEEKEKFLIIQSEEISDRFENKPLHLNATNIHEKIDPQGGNSVVEVLQNNIDAVIRQKEELDVPMIVHINHPNFGYAITLSDMLGLRNERFFEVYNGHHLVRNSGDSTHMSTEKMWDLININYIQNNKPIMYGLATDDTHNYHIKGSKWSNAGRGWIVLRADSLHQKSIIEAMEAGDFYSSTGVELEEVTFKKNKLSVSIIEEAGVSYKFSFIGCKKGEKESEILKTVEGTNADFKMNNEILFVRCKITSSKLHENPIEDFIYETAWTQPVHAGTSK